MQEVVRSLFLSFPEEKHGGTDEAQTWYLGVGYTRVSIEPLPLHKRDAITLALELGPWALNQRSTNKIVRPSKRQSRVQSTTAWAFRRVLIVAQVLRKDNTLQATDLINPMDPAGKPLFW